MDRSQQLAWIYDTFGREDPSGVIRRVLDDDRLDGRRVHLDGNSLVNFGSCSYLGLEVDDRLKRGAIEAIERYGTQLSSSRSFMSASLYGQLEPLLCEMFDGYAVATPTTTLGHLAALPVLVSSSDVVLMDQYAHASLHLAASTLAANGTRTELLRHNDLAALEERIEALAPDCERVWYIADGVYSMRGDLAPIGSIHALLGRHPQLHFYVDDAHGISWRGKHGRGAMLEKFPLHARMVVAASLNKCFAAGGGAIIVPDATIAETIRAVGPTMMFAGPLQPGTLGAAVASARIHLSPEITERQDALRERVEYCNSLLEAAGIPLASTQDSPIRYVPCGLPRVGLALGARLRKDGFFANPVHTPAVPMRRAGVRFTLTLHHTRQDIEGIVASLDRNYEAAFADCGDDVSEVFDDFRMVPTPRIEALRRSRSVPGASRAAALRATSKRTIGEVATERWNEAFAGRGAFDIAGMRFLEDTFGPLAGRAAPDDWTFRYLEVEDPGSGGLLAAAPFTLAPWKADMLAPAVVSEAVEARRATEPEYLTLRPFAMGCALTEGEHLFLDRDAPGGWRAALSALLDTARAEARDLGADAIVLRDLPDDDPDLDAFICGEGFIGEAMPESYRLDLEPWRDEEAFVAGLRSKARYAYRSEVAAYSDVYRREIVGKGARPLGDDEHEALYDMYLTVKRRNLALNTFDLPRDFFRRVEADPSWELVLLRATSGFGEAGDVEDVVSVGACYANASVYVPTVLGMDDRYVRTGGLYRQAIRHAILRAVELGCERVDLGFGNGLAKRRFGARPSTRRMYIQAIDSYALEALAKLRDSMRA